MIKNLIVNGCSFTDSTVGYTWPILIADQLKISEFHNLASGGAGNYYISNSTINFLENQDFDPNETMVLIMWSGTKRKDLNVAGEWWYHIQKYYRAGQHTVDDQYFIFSGGGSQSRAWKKTPILRDLFQWPYKLSDPTIDCRESLVHFLNLENYLKVKGYKYKFTSYCNYWDSSNECNEFSGDYNIAHFCQTLPIFKKFNFLNWFFINNNKDCLGEYANSINQFDNTRHPTQLAHENFAKLLLSNIKQSLITDQ